MDAGRNSSGKISGLQRPMSCRKRRTSPASTLKPAPRKTLAALRLTCSPDGATPEGFFEEARRSAVTSASSEKPWVAVTLASSARSCLSCSAAASLARRARSSDAFSRSRGAGNSDSRCRGSIQSAVSGEVRRRSVRAAQFPEEDAENERVGSEPGRAALLSFVEGARSKSKETICQCVGRNRGCTCAG
jgi:hypothetical protein